MPIIRLFTALFMCSWMLSAVEIGARPATTATVVFGGGCFWFMESAFRQVDGVVDATVGYAGGVVDRPSYEHVCEGTTGHAEVVQVVYDPNRVGIDRLLRLFFQMHDPTTLNRQGADAGTQYRSAIFTTNREQIQAAIAIKADLITKGTRVVTEILPLPSGAGRFHAAETYHQDYYRKNPGLPYCAGVVRPKMASFMKMLKAELERKP